MIGVQSLGPVAPRRAAEDSLQEAADGVPSRWNVDGAPRPAVESPAVPSAAGAADLERDAWVVLLSVSGLGPVSFGALLGAFGSAREVLSAACQPNGPERLVEALASSRADAAAANVCDPSSSALFDGSAAAADGSQRAAMDRHDAARTARAVTGRQPIGLNLASRICEAALDGARIAGRIRACGLTVMTLDEPEYPDRLRRVEMPPPVLYVRGDPAVLSAGHAIAVVGTRWPTDKGRLVAGWIASAVVQAGGVVVSGLAVGIDGAAHAAVVAERGRTVAVLGGGHDRLFPRAHERLAESIVAGGGAVVSELAPQISPSRGTFPRRNRLVSGLSDATVVVEAGVRSGALITAGWALEQGRECFIVPGAFGSAASAGCHAFLRAFPGQARVVSGVAELIEDLEMGAADAEPTTEAATPAGKRSGAAPASSLRGAGRAATIAALGPVERVLAEELANGAATADQLAARTSLSSAAVLSALTLLELRGLVAAAYGRYSPSGALAGWADTARS